MAEYRTTAPILVQPIGLQTHRQFRETISYMTSRWPDVDRLRSNAVHEILGRLFMTPDDSIYPVTAAISEFRLSESTLNGIAYPSVRAKEDYNYALRATDANLLLAVVDAEAFRIDRVVDGGQYMSHVASAAVSEDRSIFEWTAPRKTPNWPSFKQGVLTKG